MANVFSCKYFCNSIALWTLPRPHQCWRAADPRPQRSTRYRSTPGGSACPSSPTAASRLSATSPKLWHWEHPQVRTVTAVFVIWLCDPFSSSLQFTSLAHSDFSDDGLPAGRHQRSSRWIFLLWRHSAKEISRHGLPGCHGQKPGLPDQILQVKKHTTHSF